MVGNKKLTMYMHNSYMKDVLKSVESQFWGNYTQQKWGSHRKHRIWANYTYISLCFISITSYINVYTIVPKQFRKLNANLVFKVVNSN